MQAFAENGYRGTSIERIVEIADTTAPTFYRHFPSKRDMLAPLRDRLVEEVGPVFRRLDSDQSQTLDHIRRWVRVYVNMWRRMHRLCEAHWEAVAADAEYAAETMTITLEIVDSLPALLGRYHGPTREKMRLRLAMMLVLLDRVVHLARDEPDEMRGEVILDQFAEMLWMALYSGDTEANVRSSAQIPLSSTPRKL
jgi:AcrR family transcriptional regulator